MMADQASIVVRALKATQADGVAVFSFFLPGSDVVRVADISRIVRPNGELKGFQRPAIREHVRDIADFLSSGPVLFPNAIILALSPEVEFRHARGSRPAGMLDVADSGTLTLPVRPEGERAAWIVDGQQRAMALARASKTDIAVPVVGFVSSDLSTHREQFILVNQAKPLDVRLIDELLPEVAALLPKRLATRKLPSELVKALARDRDSPFRGLVRKADGEAGSVSVSDTALVESIRQSLRAPMGALNRFLDEAGDGRGTDADAMYNVLIQYWSAVRCAFPDAWGLPPNESRLMHSAGLRAMSALMDQIMIRADTAADPKHEIAASLARLAPHCAWTAGAWGGDLKLAWNDVQATNQHVARLARHLCRLDRDLARPNR